MRPGLTYETAKQVFLKEMLDSLGVRRARATHGSGGNATWQKHLERFRKEMEGKTVMALPDSFPQDLLPLFEQLWLKANEGADQRFEEVKQSLKSREEEHIQHIATLEANLREQKAQTNQADERYDALKLRFSELEHSNIEKEQQFIRINTKNEAQIASLIDKNRDLLQRLEQAKESHQHLNKQLEERDEQARETASHHTKEVKRLEASETRWLRLYEDSQEQNRQLNDLVKDLKADITTLQKKEKEQSRLESSLRSQLTQRETEWSNKHTQLEKDLQNVQRQLELQESNIQLMTETNASLKIRLTEKEEAGTTFENENQKLKQKLSELQAQVDNIQSTKPNS